jgi:hypothetical protein
MTKKATVRESELRRAIRAARKEGLHVVGVKPDGTLLFSETPLVMSTDMVGTDNDWSNPEV